MRTHLFFFALVIAICFPEVEAQMPPSAALVGTVERETTEAVIAQVKQAIEDEIYDYKREGLFFEIDGNKGGDHTPAVLSVYVSKELSSDGVGVVVYDDMPYGQIYRYFSVGQDGTVKLSGDPQGPFRNWGGSVLTIYMKMEDVCNFLTKQAIKESFIVDPDVPKERIRLATERQIQRTGYSFRSDHDKPAVHSKHKLDQ